MIDLAIVTPGVAKLSHRDALTDRGKDIVVFEMHFGEDVTFTVQGDFGDMCRWVDALNARVAVIDFERQLAIETCGGEDGYHAWSPVDGNRDGDRVEECIKCRRASRVTDDGTRVLTEAPN